MLPGRALIEASLLVLRHRGRLGRGKELMLLRALPPDLEMICMNPWGLHGAVRQDRRTIAAVSSLASRCGNRIDGIPTFLPH